MNVIDKLSFLPAKIDSMGKTGRLTIWKYKDDFVWGNDYWSAAYTDQNNFPIECNDKRNTYYLISCEQGFENTLDDLIKRLKNCNLI